jgi:hypothetical protein
MYSEEKRTRSLYAYICITLAIFCIIFTANESLEGDFTNWITKTKRIHTIHPAKDRYSMYNYTGAVSKSLHSSYGYLNIPDTEWDLKRAIHARQSANQHGGHRLSGRDYFSNNWEPTTSCDFEERMGHIGEGGKWVCNPYKLANKECNVISIGSDYEFSFEEAIHKLNPSCAVHTFDHTMNADAKIPSFIHFHRFGIGDTQEGKLLTMEGIIRMAGFTHKQIDIVKIDCEGCEINVFPDMMGHPIRQILMEIHGWRRISQFDIDELFETMNKNKFVIFHKEPNLDTMGECVEYGFVNMDLTR